MTEKHELNQFDLLKLYQEDCQLFYLPYAENRKDVEETYQWRKKILRKLEELLDKEYEACYNKS